MSDDREPGPDDVSAHHPAAPGADADGPSTTALPVSDAVSADAVSSDAVGANKTDTDEVAAPDGSTEPTDVGDGADTPAVPPPGESRRQRRKREKAATPRRKAPWWELPLLVALAIGIAILVKSFVVQPFFIPSPSMEPTLHGCDGCSGDRILVNKPIYSVLRDPEPGDIVVFDAPPGWDDETPAVHSDNPVVKVVRGFGQLVGFVPPDGEVLVKRVIAVGGQTIKGDAEGHVMVSTNGRNGPFRTLADPYTAKLTATSPPQRAFGPVTVPKDRLWVMGDNRANSADSRYHCTPGVQSTEDDDNCNATSSTVPVDNVIGKAMVIAWPPSRWRTLGTPSAFDSAADAAGPALPSVASLGVVVPVFVVRRRRRRTG